MTVLELASVGRSLHIDTVKQIVGINEENDCTNEAKFELINAKCGIKTC